MYRTILDGKVIATCPTEFNFLAPESVDVKMQGTPRWIWLEEACAKMPDDQVMAIGVPAEETCRRYASNIRCALAMAGRTNKFKWSIRQSKDEKWVVIAKAGVWAVSQ